MTAPLVATGLLGSLAGPSIIVLTTDVGASVAIAGIKLASSYQSSRPTQSNRRSIHTATRRHASLYHHTSPHISQTSALRTRTSSSLVPLDQRANFWHRSAWTGRSPYGFKAANGEAQWRSVEQQWAKNVEKMNHLHEMMRRRHMDFMKRRLETEPYDVLFGWRNRLREGEPQQMWVKGSDVLKAKNAPAEPDFSHNHANTQSSPVQAPEARNAPHQAVEKDIEQQDNTSPYPGFARPTINTTFSTFEYDPIANRMVHRRTETSRAFEPDAQTSITSEVEALQTEQPAAQDEAAIRAEFEQYKARRFPEGSANIVDTSRSAPKVESSRNNARSLSEVAQRAKLEDSFQKVHKTSNDGQLHKSLRPKFAVRSTPATQQAGESVSRSQEVDADGQNSKYDSVLDNLAARIKDVGDRLEKLQSSGSTSAVQADAEELLRQQFRDFRKLTAKASSDASASQVGESNKTISFKQLHKDEQTKPFTPSQPNITQQHVYEILAYDPVTSEVNSTTMSAPMAAKEQVMGISEALGRLAEPAKFMPHLRLLKERGFEPVTATNNMLVLRNIPNAKAQAQPGSQTTSSYSSAQEPSYPQPEEQSDHFDYGRWAGRRHRGWRRRRFVRRVLFWGAVTGTVVYVARQRSEYRHEREPKSRDAAPADTEEELYRAIREGSGRPRRDSYSGMRKVTYPKDKDT